MKTKSGLQCHFCTVHIGIHVDYQQRHILPSLEEADLQGKSYNQRDAINPKVEVKSDDRLDGHSGQSSRP
jgi:hypothetical protein